MSKPNLRVPKYRQFKPRNLGVVRLDGKDYYCPGVYNSDESLSFYYQLLADWQQKKLVSGKACEPKSSPSQAIGLNELILRYWTFSKGYFVKNGIPTSEQACIRSALRYARRMFGGEPAADFGPMRLKAVRQSMIDAGLARSTINQHVGRIKRLFAWAVENELIAVEPYQRLQTVRGLLKGRSDARETEPVGPVAREQVDKVLPYLLPVVRAMVEFQWHTGCRPTEVCLVRPADIDQEGDHGTWIYVPQTHKTEHHGQMRRIFMGANAQAALLPYLSRPVDNYCFDPREAVFRKRDGHSVVGMRSNTKRRPKQLRSHYDKDSYRRAIERACRHAGIPVWSPNQLRHSCATAIRAQYGLEAAQTVLGHSKVSTTEIYAERDFRLAASIAGEIG